MKTYCLSIFLGLLVLAQATFAELSIPECTRFEVDAPSTGIYQLFREKFPFHLQTVGIDRSNATDDTVILAEPPFDKPNAHEALLQKLLPFKLTACEIRKHPIGYDGWVKDLVLTFPKLSDDQAENLLSLLHQELFGTDYKADTFDLTRLASEEFDWSNSQKQYDFDIRLPASEIRKAFLESDEQRFVEISKRDGATLSARELLAQGKHGVFVTTYPGFVAWVLKQKAELPDKAEIRRFALESDLILGAVADEENVLVLARKRIVPTTVLPPLRAEDLVLLAAAAKDTDELAQSFRWDYPFAGKFLRGEERGKDWVPAYLSDILVDSHFGSVLNIADILIKSWSEKGTYKADGFEKYPNPQEWPPFSKGLFKTINDEVRVDNLKYNWNTRGAFVIYSDENYKVFSLSRSGSLLVSYTSLISLFDISVDLPHGKYEEQGYSYFSTLSDSYLVQVARYSSLFSLFRNFSIFNSEYQIQDDKYNADEFTKEEMGEFNIQESDDDVLFDRLNSADLSLLKDDETMVSYVQDYVSRVDLPTEQLAILNSHLLKSMYWINLKSIKEQESFNSQNVKKVFKLIFVDIEGIKQRYADYIQSKKEDNWLRTPSIVVSTNSMGGTGGHNVNAEATNLTGLEPSPDGTDTVEQVQENVTTKVLAQKLAPQIAGYLSNKTFKQLAEAGLKTFVLEEGYTVSVNFPEDVLVKGNMPEGQPLTQIDADVLIQDSQIQMRVRFSNENRGGHVMAFNVNSSATASLVDVKPLYQAGEFLSARMAMLKKQFIYIKKTEGQKVADTEVFFNGKRIRVQNLKEAIKDMPSETPVFFTIFKEIPPHGTIVEKSLESGSYKDFRGLFGKKSLEDEMLPIFIFAKDGDVMQASANYDEQISLDERNMAVFFYKEGLDDNQKLEFDRIEQDLKDKGITVNPEGKFPNNMFVFAERGKKQEALQAVMEKYDVSKTATILGECGNAKFAEKANERLINKGAYSAISFSQQVNPNHLSLLVEEMHIGDYDGMKLAQVVRVAIPRMRVRGISDIKEGLAKLKSEDINKNEDVQKIISKADEFLIGFKKSPFDELLTVLRALKEEDFQSSAGLSTLKKGVDTLDAAYGLDKQQVNGRNNWWQYYPNQQHAWG